jgi:glycosyltransferase involved in cell wall biosynthesis
LKSVKSAPETLSLIVPIYNEGDLLWQTLRDFHEWLSQYPAKAELILVTDGSRQDTLTVVSRISELLRGGGVIVTWIRLPHNRGKGAAVRAGAARSMGNIIAFADADASIPVSELTKLLSALQQGADVAIASRRSEGAHPRVTSPWMFRSLPGWLLNRYAQQYFTPGIRDTQCGMKAYRRAVIRKILPHTRIDRFAFDIEWLALALREGFVVREVGVRWIPRKESSVRLIRDGIRAIRDLVKLRQRLAKYSHLSRADLPDNPG